MGVGEPAKQPRGLRLAGGTHAAKPCVQPFGHDAFVLSDVAQKTEI